MQVSGPRGIQDRGARIHITGDSEGEPVEVQSGSRFQCQIHNRPGARLIGRKNRLVRGRARDEDIVSTCRFDAREPVAAHGPIGRPRAGPHHGPHRWIHLRIFSRGVVDRVGIWSDGGYGGRVGGQPKRGRGDHDIDIERFTDSDRPKGTGHGPACFWAVIRWSTARSCRDKGHTGREGVGEHNIRSGLGAIIRDRQGVGQVAAAKRDRIDVIDLGEREVGFSGCNKEIHCRGGTERGGIICVIAETIGPGLPSRRRVAHGGTFHI